MGERLVVEVLVGTPIAERRIELVERKGIGHPDTICDALVESISQALSRMYVERVGALLHYNVDKAFLVAGQCHKTFGSGEIVRPMDFIVGDRATLGVGDVPAIALPVEETVRLAVETWIGHHLPHLRPSKHLRIRPVLAPASAELQAIYGGGEHDLQANDTSAASGYAPLTPTEQLVLAVEHYLNGPEFKAAFPDTGEDVKVFGLRRDDHVSLTVAMPFRCERITSEAAYFGRKEAVLGVLCERFRAVPFELTWKLNSLDRPARGADGTYLTLTGTSAEDADSGQVGRGNRVNGLIAFARPAGSEAAPGKNPAAHPGKLYSVLSQRLAREIHARCPGLREVYVHLATRIGEPVDRPWAGVQLALADGVALRDVEQPVRDIIDGELARMPIFKRELIGGQYPVC